MHLRLNLLEKFENLVSHLENSKLHITFFIMFFLAIIALRGFWESYSDTPVGNLQDYVGPMIPHFFFWYITLALMVIFILHLATKENIIKTAKAALPAFTVLLIVPFIDIILSWGKGADITYMLPNIHHDIFIRWFTLAGSTPMGMGGTLGLKLEGLLVPFLSFFYVFIKKENILKTIVVAFIVYSTVFWWGSLPYLIYYLQILFNVEHIYSEFLLTNFELFIIIIFGSTLFFMYTKDHLKDFIEKTDILKIIIYELFFFIGVAIAWNQTKTEISPSQITIFYWIFALVLIPVAFAFQKIINHITSTVEHLGRNIFPDSIPFSFFKTTAAFLFIFIIVYSFVISFTVTFLMLIFVFSYFLYYSPILNLYKIPILSKVLIAQNVIVITFLGYFLVLGRFNEFPYQVLILLFFGLPILISMIDIKNYEYDQKHDILTIPTIFGFKKGRILIGIFFPIIFAIPGIIFDQMLLTVIMVIVGIIDFILIIWEKYREEYIFLTLIFMLIGIILYLFFNPAMIPY